MPAIDLKPLVARLNDDTRRALEAAAGNALTRTHYNVEIEHWLLQMLDVPLSDIDIVVREFDIDRHALVAGLNRSLDRQATGNGRAPGLSPDIVAVMKDAWLFASLEYEQRTIRSGHLLRAAMSDETIATRLAAAAPDLRRMLPDLLRRDLARLVEAGREAPSAEVAPDAMAAASGPTATPALDRYTVDLTALARARRIDPVLGRDVEIRQVIDVLIRRRQNNPILTGEAGVGKTAIAEGLALRIVAGDVPPSLVGVAIRTLDLGLLQAGAGVKGEFENRLRGVIDEAQASLPPVILFVDEAHTLIGSGGAPGTGDAANLLKPPLARGELRVIAATTWAEYKRHIEKDAALARRFQAVTVAEPAEPVAIGMVRGLVPSLEAHHGVRILDEAVQASVRLSGRFIQGRQWPDKAVSLIDTACARVAMSHAATPPAVEHARRRLAAIGTETGALRREEIGGADHGARLASLAAEADALRERLGMLEQRWEVECGLASELDAVRTEADASDTPLAFRDRIVDLTGRLRAAQDGQPMVFPVVDTQAVAEIVENWTGIPAGRMRADEIASVLGLAPSLARRVIGQDHALQAVARAIQTSRAGLTDPGKPLGVFLMVGTSGVGKTETALALAELVYGGEQNLTTINMSEFKEEHRVSLLTGSPPGYVGYGEGGVLTEAVRRRPYGVLLLDEIDRAHPGVQDVFFQVFDKGTMKDGEGRDIDFRNTIIVMTSNAGTATIEKLFADADTAPDPAALAEILRTELATQFKPAFLGRVSLVPYLPLASDTLRQIVDLQFERVAHRVARNYGAVLDVTDAARDLVAERSRHAPSGARSIQEFLARHVLPDLSAQLLARAANGLPVTAVTIDRDDDGMVKSTIGNIPRHEAA